MDLALLIVRIVVGLGFAAHGAQKLFGAFGGYGLAGTGGFFESIGFRPGRAFAAAAGFSEFAGGLLIALGLFGPIGPMLVFAVMTTAILSVHLPKGFFITDGGYELNLAYMGLALLFAVGGYGAYSLDAALGIASFWTPALDWGAVALGIVGGLANMAVRKAPSNQPAGN